MKIQVKLGKGSPNRLLITLGTLLAADGQMRQKDLAKSVNMPISSLVDQIKKANLIPKMEIKCTDGWYQVVTLSPIFSKKALIELVISSCEPAIVEFKKCAIRVV
jgi:hypothetical protein